MRILRLTTVFAGIAAVFTAGGIGRLAAHASVDTVGGRVRAIYIAARAHAAAGAGLIFIAAIPHGHFPARGMVWLAIPLVGMVFGGLCGIVIGTVCGGAAPVRISDVMALARKPSDALRQLLDPEDLLRIGAAVRDRTTHLFEGMFEPAQKPPTEPKPDVDGKPGEALIAPTKDAPRE